jgi:hypothetical protein
MGLRNGGGGFGVAIGNDHPCAPAGQHCHTGCANAAAAAGNKGRAASEILGLSHTDVFRLHLPGLSLAGTNTTVPVRTAKHQSHVQLEAQSSATPI